jgi:DNA-binding NarL/FixJ family response regulator
MKPSAQYEVQVRPTPRPVRLTPRELEVLALLCEGLPNKLISRRLEISAATVKCHISRILSELRVSSRLQAVVAAQRHGLVNEPDQEGQPVRDSLTPAEAATRGIRLVGGINLLQ